MIIQTVSSGIIDLFMVLRKNKIRHLPVEAIITMFIDPGVLDFGWDKVLTHLLMQGENTWIQDNQIPWCLIVGQDDEGPCKCCHEPY